MAPSDQTLHDLAARDQSPPAYLYIDEQNIFIQRFWAIFGCAMPLLIFFAGMLLCGAVTQW